MWPVASKINEKELDFVEQELSSGWSGTQGQHCELVTFPCRATLPHSTTLSHYHSTTLEHCHNATLSHCTTLPQATHRPDFPNVSNIET